MVRVTVKHQVKHSKGARAYRMSGRKVRAMKRTTKRGAYKRGNKKAMMIRRSPFTETKIRSAEAVVQDFPELTDRTNYVTYNSEITNMNPVSYFVHKQGLENNEVIGNSIFCKYLKQKISVRFPQPGFITNSQNKVIPFVPQRYELIWGFVPAPMNLTGSTTPAVDEVSVADINTYINKRVLDYVNQQKDKLRFIPKKASTIRILGRRRVRPDMRFLSTAPPTSSDNVGTDTAVGTIPNYDTSISWPCMRKLHLEKSERMTESSPGVYREGMYGGNYNQLPFCVFINWDWVDLPYTDRNLRCPALAWNNQLWFSDS